MKILEEILLCFEFIDKLDYIEESGMNKIERLKKLLPIFFDNIQNEISGKSKDFKIDILKKYILKIYSENEQIAFYISNFQGKFLKKYSSEGYEIPDFEEIEIIETYESIIDKLGLMFLAHSIYIDELLLDLKIPIEKINLLEYFKLKNKLDFNNQKNGNPYPEVFPCHSSYSLFMDWHNEFKTSNNQLANYSVIYRLMFKDGLIMSHFRPQMYINWLIKAPFNVNLKFSLILRISVKSEKLYLAKKNIYFPTS
jgi:hypothetical protein